MSTEQDSEELNSAEYEREWSTSSVPQPRETSGRKRLPWMRRMVKKDSKRFMKYVQATSTHGMVYIFTGKSKSRRVFWALFFLAALSYCVYAVIAECLNYKSVPTTTTIFSEHVAAPDFPSVTVCNLSPFKKSYLVSKNLTYIVEEAFNTRGRRSSIHSLCSTDESNPYTNLTIRELQQQGAQRIEDFIVECNFLGTPCNLSRDFTVFLTQLGVCYTFNSGRTYAPRKVSGSGLRHSLQLVLNIEQHDYGPNINSDAGARVVIKSNGVPPIPAGEGISIPPGTNGFISIRQSNIDDRSNTGRCWGASKDKDLKLLKGYKYSISACIQDCVVTEIAHKCNCLDSSVERPSSGPESTLPACQVANMCCIVSALTTAAECACNVACQYNRYEFLTSYSSFPSSIELQTVADLYNTTADAIQTSFLGVHVYFEQLIVYQEVTVRAENVGSLLSSIGGLLGLFIGGSVITVTEFIVWLLDELKDRCLGLSDHRVKEQYNHLSADLKERLVYEKPSELEDLRTNRRTFISVERSTVL